MRNAHISKVELERILAAQRAAFQAEGTPSAAVRRNRIDRLCLAVLESADELALALQKDYGRRPVAASKSYEALAWLGDASSTREQLEGWMEPVDVSTKRIPGFVQQKPKGVVGIVTAWNFPVQLCVSPAVAALAAGNRVMMKFTDVQQATGQVFADAIAKHFAEDEVAVITGDLETARAFSTLQLDHLMFTGSPAVGRIVAMEAGKNLVPVTLELGGKNPAVLAPEVDIEMALPRIAGTRSMNGGQICLCPDYILAPSSRVDEVIEGLKQAWQAIFPNYLNNPGVISIVNEQNYDRVIGLIDEAVALGATKIEVIADDEAGQLPNRELRLIPPTILANVPAAARINHEEIFGPVLPIVTYAAINEAIDYIAARPAPLAAYWYGDDNADFQHFLTRTTSGGVTRNDGMLHFQLDAPFGGVGNSGTGAYHGKAGFDEFTHRRVVASQEGKHGSSAGMVGAVLASPEFEENINGAVAGALAMVLQRMG